MTNSSSEQWRHVEKKTETNLEELERLGIFQDNLKRALETLETEIEDTCNPSP